MKTPLQDYLFELQMLLGTAVQRNATRLELMVLNRAIKLAQDQNTVENEKKAIINAWVDCCIKMHHINKQPTQPQLHAITELATMYYNQTYGK